MDVLMGEGVMSRINSLKYEFELKGSMEYEGNTLDRVFADALPSRYEPTPPNIRSNVMGLSAMWALKAQLHGSNFGAIKF